MKLKVKKLHNNAILPQYATTGAACFDLHACETVVYGSGKSAVIDTGLGFEVPEGFVLLIYSRSGHGFNQGWRLANAVGVIDSDFRGSVKVKLVSDRAPIESIQAGDRIAQAMLVAAPRVEFFEVDQLSETLRGNGGFGSTGQ